MERYRHSYQGLYKKERSENQHNYSKYYREILNLAQIFMLPGMNEEEELHHSLHLNHTESRSGLKPLLIWNRSHQNQADYVIYLIQRLLGSIKSVQISFRNKPGGYCNTVSLF